MAERGQYNSSLTRVAPVFDAISRQSNWVARLLELPRHGIASPRIIAGDLSPVPRGCHWGESEKGLLPPVSLLSWLVRNFKGPVQGESDTVGFRRKLADGDPATIEMARLALRTAKEDRGWWIFEGPTYPDAYVVTPDLLLVVEGKRTESGTTTSTTWMSSRHQIWRHIDAAWEIRGLREVAGLLIVEGDSAGEVPAKWVEAALDAGSPSALHGSFPHRSAEEVKAISESFRGVTTWQAVCEHFGLDRSTVLLDKVVQ